MATLYYNNAVDTNWNTLGNWWQTINTTVPSAYVFSNPAVAIPTTGDTAEMHGDVTVAPTVHVEYAAVNWRGGGNMCDFTFLNATITFYKTFDNFHISYNDFTGSVNNGTFAGSGTAGDFTSNDGSVVNGTFSNGTNQNGTVTNGTFNNTSINQATVTNGTFNNSASNQNGATCAIAVFNGGTNFGDCPIATLNGSTLNATDGTITTATMNDTSTNDGTITTATMNGSSSNGQGDINTAYIAVTRSGVLWHIRTNYESTDGSGSIGTINLTGVPDAFSGAILTF